MKFSKANSKLAKLYKKSVFQPWLSGGRKIFSFDMPSGHTCPLAKDCLSYVDRRTGKVVDGPDTDFRCFKATLEAVFKNLNNLVWSNYQEVKRFKSYLNLADRMLDDMPDSAGIIRWHTGGDWFSKVYFEAMLEVAARRPDMLFYFYTKMIPFLVSYSTELAARPNIVWTASAGGKRDDLIEKHQLRQAVVCYSEQEADDMGLDIDYDDSHAANPHIRHQSFALLIHGQQPAGSEAAKALQILSK
tara:strand:+ start:893 stop:1627 length:735 start_codon:yes stop_codon:yes gene_type:complete